MAEKNEKSKKQKQPRTWSSTKILDCVAYFAMAFIAIALILRLIFQNIGDGRIASAFQSIGECLAYIICIWLGFYWTLRQRRGGWNKRSVWWLVGWLVSTVVIVVIYIVAII